MSYRNWTDEELIEAVKTSTTKFDVIKKIRLLPSNSGNYQTIDRYIKILNIDISHLKSETDKSGNGAGKKLSLDKILVENSKVSNFISLKRRLVKEKLLNYQCYKCKIQNWCGEKLVLQMDHINGDRSDNRIENLRLLCPNCHSQTETFCIGNRKIKDKNRCYDCNILISKTAKQCTKCSGFRVGKKLERISWPITEDLIKMVDELGYVGTGRKLGVTDNAVRRRIKNHPLKT